MFQLCAYVPGVSAWLDEVLPQFHDEIQKTGKTFLFGRPGFHWHAVAFRKKQHKEITEQMGTDRLGGFPVLR